MKMGSYDELVHTKPLYVFAQSRLFLVLMAVVSALLSLLLCCLLLVAKNPLAIAVLLLLLSLFAYTLYVNVRDARAAFEPKNWVMQITSEGILLQLRSYLANAASTDGRRRC